MPEPVLPPPSRWRFPPPDTADEDGIVGVGADLSPGTLLAAYRSGLFPMPVARSGPLAWWSPDPRGVIPLAGSVPERGHGLRISRSLRRSCRRYELTVDRAFDEVIEACGDPTRPHGWLAPAMVDAYTELHRMGWVHSVEAWTADGRLAGGLYGVAIGGLFAGESMFHRETDASKVALVGLVERLRGGGGTLLDVQWVTPHLATLGAIAVPRTRYLELLGDAVRRPHLPWQKI